MNNDKKYRGGSEGYKMHWNIQAQSSYKTQKDRFIKSVFVFSPILLEYCPEAFNS